MFKVDFFNEYGEYQKKNFRSKKSFLKFLRECEQNNVEVLDFTDHYYPND